ncbi:hypothetical protein KKF34_16615 [Myxococcota bacterium]|nr:hypothetical protein [Myxococcota bacterium]MBU1379787.1 hypothetical protein [Myxococcota bacterium]MBU1498501.1 hypothetical protein [Myxococcota bacterium]
MFNRFLLTALAFFTVAAGFSGTADANRRLRLHTRWTTGYDVNYLTDDHYNSCWSASEALVAPDSTTYNVKYGNCLENNRYRFVRSPHRRARIVNTCRAHASQLVFPSEYQQQNAYVNCLSRARYNIIRDHLYIVSCDHLYGRHRNACIARVNADIAAYGYSNPSHYIYLDNLYRTRYRSFHTRYPNHRHVKRYHTRYHTPRTRVVHRHHHTPGRTVVKHVHHRGPDRVVVKHHNRPGKTVVKHVRTPPRRVEKRTPPRKVEKRTPPRREEKRPRHKR